MLTNKKTLLALSVVSALTLTACGSDNDDNVVVTPPTPPVVVVPETPAALSFTVSGNVVNSTSGAPIEVTKLTFLEGDVASTDIVDINGKAITELATTDGSYTFTLKDGADVTTLTVLVSAEGYISKSFALDLTDKSVSVAADLSLVSATSGNGVVAATEKAAVSAGQVATEVAVTATQAGANTNVTVPAGTTLQDENGNAVSGTEVSLNVATAATTASATTAGIGDIIPAGLNSGTSTSVRQPLAAANIEMLDNAGNKIKKFSSPITLTLSVPESAGVTTGDTLKVSSYDEDKAKWTLDEFTATVGAFDAASKTYAASFQTSHLTLFTSTKEEPACTSGINFNVTGANASELVFHVFSSDGYVIRNATGAAVSSSSRNNLKADATARVLAFDAASLNVVFDSQTEVPVCGTVDVAVTAAPVTTVNENFAVTAVCSNDTTKTTALSGAIVKYRLPNRGFEQASEPTAGTYALTGLVEGSSYQVRVVPRGLGAGVGATDFTITANGTDESGSINIACNTTTGGN
ncbi:hypothetical protein ACFOEE_03030 [Pseudoalteromonas fenneropenaei]|uniref:Carboxypeptidase regulatory-like domain-containing protein n=1 Tax=Pseudoalteromonas fenneropenaei TaxID=1737459 RepID=A0ABV7CG03_9GAMM